MKPQIVRQSKFDTNGNVSDIPAKNTEQPQLERQLSLLTWAKENELKVNWRIHIAP